MHEIQGGLEIRLFTQLTTFLALLQTSTSICRVLHHFEGVENYRFSDMWVRGGDRAQKNVMGSTLSLPIVAQEELLGLTAASTLKVSGAVEWGDQQSSCGEVDIWVAQAGVEGNWVQNLLVMRWWPRFLCATWAQNRSELSIYPRRCKGITPSLNLKVSSSNTNSYTVGVHCL